MPRDERERSGWTSPYYPTASYILALLCCKGGIHVHHNTTPLRLAITLITETDLVARNFGDATAS